jgi:hypothetical protein
MSKILCKFEGGLGDCFLSNRLLHAIYEKYPNDEIQVALDTDGSSSQESALRKLWPSKYSNSFTIGKRLNKTYYSPNIFGNTVDCPTHPLNMPKSFHDAYDKCDIYFDLKVASLQFMKYDIPWLNWFYHFPRPETHVKYTGELPEKYIVVHLYPRPDTFHKLDRDYSIALIKELRKVLPVVALCNKEHFSWYEGSGADYLLDPNIEEAFDICSRCVVFYGADSSFRYIPYHFGKPSYVLSRHCYKPHDIKSVNHSQHVRWLIYRHMVLPHNWDIQKMVKLTQNIAKSYSHVLIPEYSDGIDIGIDNNYRFDWPKEIIK